MATTTLGSGRRNESSTWYWIAGIAVVFVLAVVWAMRPSANRPTTDTTITAPSQPGGATSPPSQ